MFSVNPLSKQFPISTEANFSQPIDVQAERLLVPTFILLNELHFNPRCSAKLSSTARNSHSVANLGCHTDSNKYI